MTKGYARHIVPTVAPATPQSQPIPGREHQLTIVIAYDFSDFSLGQEYARILLDPAIEIFVVTRCSHKLVEDIRFCVVVAFSQVHRLLEGS